MGEEIVLYVGGYGLKMRFALLPLCISIGFLEHIIFSVEVHNSIF